MAALVRQRMSFSDTIAAAAVSRRTKGIALTTAKILRGAPVARRVRLEVETAARSFVAETGSSPTLATVLAGSAPPSSAYRDAISQAMGACGIVHVDVLLPVAATTGRMVETIERLNERDDVHGVIVLLPLPPHIHVARCGFLDRTRRRMSTVSLRRASADFISGCQRFTPALRWPGWRSSITTRFPSLASERWLSAAETSSGSRWPRSSQRAMRP